jgi:outer membrane protein OmpA-like peptidoglycan-associated protein
VALAAAEEAYRTDADAYLVYDRAYIAIRTSELAQVLAQTEREKLARAQEPGKAADVRERLSEAERKIDETEAASADVPAEAEPAGETVPVVTGALAVRDEPRGTVITVPAQVLFASDRADFLPGATTRLKPVAETLSEERNGKIVVESCTDSVGAPIDVGLSLRRADHVRDFLVTHDVPAERVSVAGVDESGPAANAATLPEPAAHPPIIVSLRTPAP